MDRALIVLEPTETGRRLLQEAGELAAGVDARLDVLSLVTPEEYESDIGVLETIAAEESTSFDDRSAETYATETGEQLAGETLDGLGVDYTVEGREIDGDEKGRLVVETAERNGCDHVFVTGARRSPTGKAIFGDFAQAVILNFDGCTTILTDD